MTDKHPPAQKPAEADQAKKPDAEHPLPAPGSRDYVAGQPVDEEERKKTEAEAPKPQPPSEDLAK